MAKELSNWIYQLKIVLNGSNPPIWRSFLVDSASTLPVLHQVIQVVMGWDDSHLHQFMVGKAIYTPENQPEDEDRDDSMVDEYDEIRLADLISRVRQKFQYVYDFGDGWIHTLTLEKKIKRDDALHYPLCLDGKLACPPEDCGGIWGYYRLIEALKHPGTEAYDYAIDWLGEEKDWNHFDLAQINRQLR